MNGSLKSLTPHYWKGKSEIPRQSSIVFGSQSVFVFLCVFAVSMLLVGCHGYKHHRPAPNPGSEDPSPPKELKDSTKKDLTFSEHEVALAFSIDAKGNVQSFVPNGWEPITFEELRNVQLIDLEAISILSVSGSHVVCTTRGGKRRCRIRVH